MAFRLSSSLDWHVTLEWILLLEWSTCLIVNHRDIAAFIIVHSRLDFIQDGSVGGLGTFAIVGISV